MVYLEYLIASYSLSEILTLLSLLYYILTGFMFQQFITY